MEQQKVESISSDSKDPIQEANNDVILQEDESKTEIKTNEMETDSGDILIDHLSIEPVVTEITTEILPIATDNNVTETVSECLDKDSDANNQPALQVSEEIVEVVCIPEPISSDVTEVTTEKETPDPIINDETSPSDEVIEEKELQDSEVAILPTNEAENTQQIDEEAVALITDDTKNTQQIDDEEANVVEEHIETHETCDASAMSIVEEIVTTSKTTTYSIEIQEQDSSDDRDSFVEKNLLMLEVVSENDSSVNVFEGSIQELEIEQTDDYDTSSENLIKEVSLSDNNKVESGNESLKKKDSDDESLKEFDSNIVSIEIVDEEAESETNVEEKISKAEAKTSPPLKKENHRSVIQEIVDDWIDDNNDDNNEDTIESRNIASDYQDSVEIELKTLLADDKLADRKEKVVKVNERSGSKSSNQPKFSLKYKKTRNNTGSAAKERLNGLENESATVKRDGTSDENLSSAKQPEVVPNYVPPHLLGRSITNPSQDVMVCKQKPQLPRAGVKVPGRHLMSQIASKAEVTEVLQERIKQKQKEIERPQRGDILFVKKITQRLSSKLSAASNLGSTGKKSASQISNVSSENCSNNSTDAKTTEEAEKIETADNRELLAILEGDVDPDWSNLKPQTVVEANKSSEVVSDSVAPAKLDPLMERELALKQLLELPTISVKKNAMKKRRTFKPAPSKVSLNIDGSISNLDTAQMAVSVVEPENTRVPSEEEDETLPTIEVVIKSEQISTDTEETHTEESRSGRKRKPTEKAREHEENSSKKQKVYKGKITVQKRSPKIQSTASESPRKSQILDEYGNEGEEAAANPKSMTGRNILSKIGSTKNRMFQSKVQKMGKKLPQNMTKRNMPVKKLIRQKASTSVTNSKSIHMKSKFMPSQKKYRNAMKQKIQKHLMDNAPSSEIKPKKKSNEIDKLLQDEGVVNLLYDVEQPERKRLVPITKSQTKVMDLQKVQRELKIRTKLVRNAVLRLRTSGGSPTKMSPRSKRNAMHVSSENEYRENERNKSTRSSISSTGDFIFPAKIRNAADASVIVRRHSSSSFSSTSGSPRVSIDGPDRQMAEPCGSEEGPAHVTRSAKRRYSQNEKNKQFTDNSPTQKKNSVSRKKSMDIVDDDGIAIVDKSLTPVRSNLRTDSKTPEKTNKNIESMDTGKSGGNDFGSKIATRSNGVSSEREVMKTKKGTKTKSVSSKVKDVVESEMEYVEEDKLSACLAEAASALSTVEGTDNRSGSTTVNRKPKGEYLIID